MVDIAVLLSILAATAAAVWRLRRGGSRGRPLLLAGWTAFQGITLVFMMTAHSVEIVYHIVAGHTSFTGSPWAYDFRTYSLLLLAAVLGAQGAWFLRLTPAMARGDEGAKRAAIFTKLALLAVVVPIIPIHAFFGVILTTIGGVGLIMLLLARPVEPARAGMSRRRLRIVAARPRPGARRTDRPMALSR